jgi:hypothetical protein
MKTYIYSVESFDEIGTVFINEEKIHFRWRKGDLIKTSSHDIPDITNDILYFDVPVALHKLILSKDSEIRELAITKTRKDYKPFRKKDKRF